MSSGEEGVNVSPHSSDLREEYTGEDSEADISLSADEILLSSSLVDSGDTDADIEVSLVAASPSGFVGRQSPPIPAPRRGTRIRRQPEWLRSGDYIVHQQQVVEESTAHGCQEWEQKAEFLAKLARMEIFSQFSDRFCQAILRVVSEEC